MNINLWGCIEGASWVPPHTHFRRLFSNLGDLDQWLLYHPPHLLSSCQSWETYHYSHVQSWNLDWVPLSLIFSLCLAHQGTVSFWNAHVSLAVTEN